MVSEGRSSGPRVTLAAVLGAVLLCGACGAPAPSVAPAAALAPSVRSPTPRPAAPSAVQGADAPSPPGDAFRVSAEEAAAVSTVERLISSINTGDAGAAEALVAQGAEGSDCDYARRAVVVLTGKPEVVRWLRARIVDHERLAVGSIFNESPIFTPVLGVEFARRSSDTLARLGFPGGVVPGTIAKVVLTPDLSQVSGLNLAPGGADASTIAQACTPA